MQNAQSIVQTDDILSQADIILPSQYFGAIGSVGLSGEQRLMLAVLVGRDQRFAELAEWWERAQTPQLCRSGTMGR